MVDVDIDLSGGTEHPTTAEWGEASRENDRTESRPDENIPLISVTPVGGRSTWEPECEQETSFGGESQRTRL